jgi:hypothetical protein
LRCNNRFSLYGGIVLRLGRSSFASYANLSMR